MRDTENDDAAPAEPLRNGRYPVSAPARVIAIRAESEAGSGDGCAGAEPYALMVLGDSMRPEFEAGDVIVVEPGGLAQDGSFVVARANGEWMLRQLRRDGERWRLAVIDGREAPIDIDGLDCIAGVVIQKSKPGRRRAATRYVE